MGQDEDIRRLGRMAGEGDLDAAVLLVERLRAASAPEPEWTVVAHVVRGVRHAPEGRQWWHVETLRRRVWPSGRIEWDLSRFRHPFGEDGLERAVECAMEDSWDAGTPVLVELADHQSRMATKLADDEGGGWVVGGRRYATPVQASEAIDAFLARRRAHRLGTVDP